MNLLPFRRSIIVYGQEFFDILINKKILIFGIGGVGSYTAESLCRTGIKNITVVDYDKVCITNINRQTIALHSTIGMNKTEVMCSKMRDINKDGNFIGLRKFVTRENIPQFNLEDYDFVIDAIDNVTAKLALMEYCYNNKICFISSMGTGNKFDPFLFKIEDISKTKICPLAKIIRKELKKRRIYKGVKVLYSTEYPITPQLDGIEDCKNNCVCPHQCEPLVIEDTIICSNKRSIPGSNSFIPPVAGLMLASYVVNSFRNTIAID